ncbi:hypothetical protein JTB14_005436 [Gonioctena quinquepunctata]|nr:hypothetical protein JTB14_005436 [Gonioctena quinquepunctata]
MTIENEIERLMKRITLLENQNARFKNLLDSALEVTKQSVSRTQIQKDETEFLEETIKLIEDEKTQMQNDLELISSSENEEILINMKKLENENVDLQKKVDLLLSQVHKHSKDMELLKREHSEFKFLLTQPESNPQWLKDILQLDNATTETTGLSLMEERYKLQRKIVSLERKKTELLTAIEDIGKPETRQTPTQNFKSDLEKALFKAIDDVAKREYENLHLKVLDLEKERSQLLNELQAVLDSSKNEIASEYCKLQRKILEIETEKAELKLALESMGGSPEKDEELTGEVKEVKGKVSIGNSAEENAELDKILNAFSNQLSQINIPEAIERESMKSKKLFKTGFTGCTIV